MTTLIDHASPFAGIAPPGLYLRIHEIANAAAAVISVEPSEVFRHNKGGGAIEARRVTMYVTRRLTDASYAQIGAVFEMDHTTVIYQVRKVERRLKFDDWTRAYVDKVLIEVAAPELLKAVL